jgi:uncharacterized protein DUF4398
MGNCVRRFAPVLLALVAGCAAAESPIEELRAARAAYERAVAAGAERSAPRELALAREKIRLGERWLAAEDYQPARWLVEQARVDAELAALKSAVAQARGSR